MKTLNEICKKDGKYVKVIEKLSIVKNAVDLLRGRQKKGGGEEGEALTEEREGMIVAELRVKEKKEKH